MVKKMNKQQKSKFLIIIIAIMLLGIGLEAFQAGSSFLCTYTTYHNQESTATLHSSASHTLLTDKLFILEGIRQSYGTTCIRQTARRTCVRSSRMSFHILALIIILPLLFVCSDTVAFQDVFQETLCSMVIIDYIHLSDGQKSRYSCTLNMC